MAEEKQILLKGDELARTLSRMAHEVVEHALDPASLVLIGIRSRGVYLARRIARKLEEISRLAPPVGALDVTAYRDDRSEKAAAPSVGELEVPVSLDDRTVVLIDDVIFRGRTIRAAMDAVARFGRPKRILVAVLVDRGARELPIRADVVGKNVEAGDEERVNVMLEESDGIDQITLAPWHARSTA